MFASSLNSDIDFIQTEAGLYAATGDTARAVQYMNRVQAYYAKAKQRCRRPRSTFKTPGCSTTSATTALSMPRSCASAAVPTSPSRSARLCRNIWANWSVRRAAAAMENGNATRAVDILDAASLAFPNNLTVRKAVAGGYARVGRAKEALGLYKTIPMQSASAGDFEGAVGAALAANDKSAGRGMAPSGSRSLSARSGRSLTSLRA